MNAQQMSQGNILEMSGNYWKSCTLHAGIRLDIFTALSKDQLTSEDVAQKLNGDKRGVTMLLNALTAMDLLVRDNDRYSNTQASASFLSKDSRRYIGHIIMHHQQIMASWSQLDIAVRTGAPVRAKASQSDEEWRGNFLMGMHNMATMLAPMLVKKIDLSRRRHLLDIGGGPGTYAIHFCLNNHQLNATVYDLPSTRPFAERIIEEFDLTGRINFMDGNYLQDGIEGVYDVVWLSHILHAEGPEDCQKIIRKAVSALEPGGMIIVHDFLLNNTMDGPLFPALFSLNMLLSTPTGQSYSEQQIMNMLAGAGINKIQRLPVQTPNNSGIITGVAN